MRKTNKEHTPGPWYYDINRLTGEYGQIIAILPDSNSAADDISVREANERLLRAAPDLLKALETMVNTCKNIVGGVGPSFESPLMLGMQAIAKAKGESK